MSRDENGRKDTTALDTAKAREVGSWQYDPTFRAISGLFESEDGSVIAKDNSLVVAFYLPQYHRIPENSEWWGPGFTEWTNVAGAAPNYNGHYQPHIPRDLGFYDLGNVDVLREQVELAKLYGVDGFCFYYYWFSGRRILDKPLNNFIKSDIDQRFCLCWANENWTRTWDGDNKSVLMRQGYEDGDAEAFIESVIPVFRDPRYIKVKGRPLLVVYRAKDIPKPKEWFAIWRERVVEAGLPGLHISVVDFYDIESPEEVEADSLLEFPPHKFNGPQNQMRPMPVFTNPEFAGGILDYSKIVAQSAIREQPPFTFFRTVMPSWDNTARRQNTPTIIENANPGLFGAWMSYIRMYTTTISDDPDERLIFINAWNEWGEGCHLEPDVRHGLSYLEEVLHSSNVSARNASDMTLQSARERLLMECARSSRLSLERAKAIGSVYRTHGTFARRASNKLSQWPAVHRVVARLYRFVIGR